MHRMITAAALALAVIASIVATVAAENTPSLRGPAALVVKQEHQEASSSNHYFPNFELVDNEEEDKPRAADRRQAQRDANRRRDNPNRSAAEDAREGYRKRIQHERSGRGRPSIDKEGGRRRDGARSVGRERYKDNDRRRDVRNYSSSTYRSNGRRRRGSDSSTRRGSDNGKRRNYYSSSTYRSNGRRRSSGRGRRDYSSSGRSCRDINKNLRRSNANPSGCKIDAYGKRSIQQEKRRIRNDRRRDGYYSSSTWGSEDDKAKARRHSADEVAVA